MTFTRSRCRALCTLAIATAPFAASAQEVMATATGGLETITVTAQRVETDIQTTPVAVSALSGDFLTQYSYDRVTSLEGAVPNLNFSASTGGASSQVSAFIRGVGEFDFLLTHRPGGRPLHRWRLSRAHRSARTWTSPSPSVSKCCAARRERCSARTTSAARST